MLQQHLLTIFLIDSLNERTIVKYWNLLIHTDIIPLLLFKQDEDYDDDMENSKMCKKSWQFHKTRMNRERCWTWGCAWNWVVKII